MELEYAWNCRLFGGLPESGGQLDQPAGLLKRMRAASTAYDAWRAWIQNGGKDIKAFKERNPTAWEIVKMILKERHG